MKENFSPDQLLRNKEESQETILNDWDRKYLEKGTTGVVLKMFEDFGKDFPDIIILPETSARPLYYIFHPIFEKLKEDKGTRMPKFLFFNVNRGVVKLNEYEGIELKTTEDFRRVLEDQFKNRSTTLDKYTHPDLLPTSENIAKWAKEAQIEKLVISKERIKERAQEIQAYLSKYPGSKIAVLDEFESSGRTKKVIDEVFDKDVPYYAVAGFHDSENAERHGVDFSIDTPDESLTPEQKGMWSRNPKHGNLKFSYSDSRGVGVSKELEKKYTTPLVGITDKEKEELAGEKMQLRYEMKDIGNIVAVTISDAIGKKYENAREEAEKSLYFLRDAFENKKVNEDQWWDFAQKLEEIQSGLSRELFSMDDINTSEQELKDFTKYALNAEVAGRIKYIKKEDSNAGNPIMQLEYLREQLAKGGMQFEDFDISENEIKNILRSRAREDAKGSLEYMRNSAGTEWKGGYDTFIEFIRKTKDEFNLSLEDMGTSEEELESLRIAHS